MKPRPFKESNLHLDVCEKHKRRGVIGIDVYHNLPTMIHGEQIIECWQMTWRERLAAIFFGRVWVWLMTGKTHIPPVTVECRRTVFMPSRGRTPVSRTLREQRRERGREKR